MPAETQRHYTVSEDPIVKAEIGDDSVRDVRLAAYEASASIWKELAGVRFKLLSLLPAASIAILVAVVTDDKSFDFLRELAKLGITAMGFSITLALRRYDLRNSQLYNDLISRCRRAEYELGIHTGAFLGRPSSLNPKIQHDPALNLVYKSCLIAWVVGGALIFIRILIAAIRA